MNRYPIGIGSRSGAAAGSGDPTSGTLKWGARSPASDPMRILVRNIRTGQFYAGRNAWAINWQFAFDFKTTGRALQWVETNKSAQWEIIYRHHDQYDIVVPPQESPQDDMGL